MAAASVEPRPAEQLVASPQGQMAQEAVMWLAKGHANQPSLHTGWGTTDASPSPLEQLHVQRLDHGEAGEATGHINVRKEENPRSNSQAQVWCHVSNVSIHPEQQSASVLFFDEVRRGSQVQCHPGGFHDQHRAL
jgi:hypothetical protein